MYGLSVVNVELTNRCNKSCWMCWHNAERKAGNVEYSDMPLELVQKIAEQLPPMIIVQLHINGEPLLYPYLQEAIDAFSTQIVCMTTNGKLLSEKATEINGLDVVTISVFENDVEAPSQYEAVRKYLEHNPAPRVVFRCSGDVDTAPYEKLGLVVRRPIHSNKGKFKYSRKQTISEHGICLDALTHLAIHCNGDITMCVTYDKKRRGVIGNAIRHSLETTWYGRTRYDRLACHIDGRRDDISPCKDCEYWGIPR